MKKLSLICTAFLLVILALNNTLVRGLMKWLNTPATTKAEIVGKDGPLTVMAQNSIVNKYAVLAANASAGASAIVINNPGGENGLDPATLTPGDLLFIIQMAGASIDTSDTPNYGTVTNLNNAGRHEFVTVNSVNGNLITINPPCSGLRFSYTVSGKVQVIRVPQYTSLTINPGATLTAPAWDGKIGGIVVVHVQNNAIIDGTVDVSGRGLRGGALSAAGGGGLRSDYRTIQQDFGAEKGEGIAGYQMDYDFTEGRYGRGAAANAGGGGTSHNSGGGGGANGNNGISYNGQGIMDSSPPFAAAWALDPACIANGNALTNSSGGGRGGYSYAVNEANALTTGPGNAAWGADLRRSVGGFGGRPVNQDTSGRIFLGGGGGAGAQNNDAGGAGGNGGGLIYIVADSVSGSGILRANGANGGNTRNEHRDGSGGAGAGGTIVIAAKTLNGISAVADGGNGGNQTMPPPALYPNESEGPGGGGGGGFIAFSGGSISTSVKGGINGTTLATSLTEFPSNGATRGADGTTNNTVASIPFCSTTTDLSITKTNNATTIVPGAPTTYAIVASNNGPNAVFGLTVTDNLAVVFGNISWTCTASPGSRCSAATGIGNINTKVDLLVNGTATFQLTATADPSATGTVTNTARVDMPDGAVDTNPDNNTASDTDTLTPQADLSINKTNAANSVTPGTNTTYNIVVRNNGPSTVSGARIIDTIPANLSNSTWTCTSSTGSSCAANSGSGNINTTVSLLVNGSATFTLTATVLSGATGSLINTATVAPPSGTTDPNLANNTSTATTPIAPTSDLRVIKTPSQNTIRAGDELTYTLAVTNLGPSSASDVVVTDVLQPGLQFLSASASQGSCTGTDTIRCNIGTLGATSPGNTTTVTIEVLVPNTFLPRQLPNTAVVQTSTPDPNPGNNSSTATVTVTGRPGAEIRTTDVSIRNSSSDICIGALSLISVELKLTNNGTGIQRDNPGPELLAELPLQLSGVIGSCTATNGQCTIRSSHVEWNGEIAAKQTVTISYLVRTRSNLQPGSRFCTEYKVNYDSNGDGENDATTSVNSCLEANCTQPPCNGQDCPDSDPGVRLGEGGNSISSDVRPGSILIFPFYTSDATSTNLQNTRISITNLDNNRAAYLHLFFVDGSTCTVADNFLCLTPNQTISFLASELDPGVPGYLIVIAVDSNGCPTKFNSLIGDAYIKTSSGHSANLGAIAVPAIKPPECDFSKTTTTINFDGIEYSRLARVLALDSIASAVDGNSTLLVLDSIGGDLTNTASTLGPIFGLLFDDKETGFSFSFRSGECQLRSTLSSAFPRTSPRFTDVVPAGHTGWMKLALQNEGAMVGVMINANPNQDGYRGGHNLHMLTLGNTSLTIPLLAPSCQ